MKSFLILDSGGLAVDIARRIGQEGNKVWYYTPWMSAYPSFEAYAPGVGVPEIEKVLDFAPYIDQADCIMFPDVGMGQLAHWLREKGYNVYGAGLAEELELDRGLSVKIMEKLGIKYPKTYEFKGVDAATEFLKKALSKSPQETNQKAGGSHFVKFNIWRGSLESFPASDIEQVEQMFDKFKHSVGPYDDQIPVIIQEGVKGIETGADLFTVDGKWLSPGMWGFEDGGNYIGRVEEDLGIFKSDLDKLTPYLASKNYRGAFSFECIYDGKDCYWIDVTPRTPLPLGLMYCTFIDDLGKFVYELATGEATKSPLLNNKYLGCMQITSEEAKDAFISLKGGQDTRFMRYMMSHDKQYSVPGTSLVGVASAQGSTLDELHENAQKEYEALEVYFGVADPRFVENIRERYVAPLAELGVNFEQPIKSLEKFVDQISSEVIVRENKELKAILSSQELEQAKDVASGEMDISDYPKLYDKLFRHYADMGEMPYSVQKGREEDPYEWVTKRLQQEMGESKEYPLAERVLALVEAITPEDRKKAVDFSKELKKILTKEWGFPIKVSVSKTVGVNPWIQVRVGDYDKDIIPNEYRKKVATSLGWLSSVRDPDDIHYGNISGKGIALQWFEWIHVLGRENPYGEGLLTNEASLDDAASKLAHAKSRVHNQEVFLKELRNKLHVVESPKQKSSLQAKVKEEEDDLREYRSVMQQREREYQQAKGGSRSAQPHRELPATL